MAKFKIKFKAYFFALVYSINSSVKANTFSFFTNPVPCILSYGIITIVVFSSLKLKSLSTKINLLFVKHKKSNNIV
jgi:hypothetical protein